MLSRSNRQPLIWIVLTVSLLGHAQEDRPAVPTTQTTLRGGAQEVLLDIVVRDKRGRLVKNLAAKDFEISDDGERQKVRGFRIVDGKDKEAAAADEAIGAMVAAAGQANTMDALRQVRIVTLVFGRLDTDARNNARVAVEELLKTETGPNLFFAVFAIDQRLSILQPYTTDKERIRKAVAKMTSSASSLFKSESDQIKEDLKALAVQQDVYGEAPLPVAGARTPSPISGSPAAIALAKLQLNMMEFSQLTDRTMQGRSDLFSLEALIGQQYSLLGRKTLLYFCAGLPIPPEYTDEFQRLISDANRFNVSVYGIDVRSLDSESKNALGNTLLKQAALASQIATNDGPVSRDQVIGVDRAIESIQANSQNSLAEISQKTGGFLIANTDVRNQLHKVTEDIDAHYELAYAPDIRNFDGRFRKISVRVNRPDMQVQSRAGYFAVPGGGEPLGSYEMPLLGALSAAELPREIRFRSSALHFQSIEGEQEGVVVFDVPLEGMVFAVDSTAQLYRIHFSVLALIKNAEGAVVRKVSQDVPRQGPLDKMEAVKVGHFIYAQHAPLPPGRYTLETALADRQTGKVSAKKSVLLIPPASSTLGLSSVVRVRSFTQSAAGDPAAAPDPFQISNAKGKISPGLDDTVKGGPGSMLSFFFTVYANQTAPQLTIEFIRDGQLLARSQPPLSAPDSHGLIPYVASTPLDAYPPGQYEMRVTVTQNGKSASERTVFTVE